MRTSVPAAAMLVAATIFAISGATAQPAAEPPLARTAADPALQWGPCPPILPAGCEIAVLHGSPAEPNADIFLRVPGGYQIPPHRHSSAERMILVTGRLRVKYQGAPETTLEPGHYAYGPPASPTARSARATRPAPCSSPSSARWTRRRWRGRWIRRALWHAMRQHEQ